MHSLNISPCCHISLSYIMGFDIKIIQQRIQTTSHASSCRHFHDCNIECMLFHYVTCYSNSLLSCIHVNIANLLNITCTLVATCTILGRLEFIYNDLSLFFIERPHPSCHPSSELQLCNSWIFSNFVEIRRFFFLDCIM